MRKDNNFNGVFARNDLPIPINNNDESIIVNTDTSNLPGKHWIAIKKINNRYIYFDPAGWIPFKNIIEQYPNTIVYSFNNSQPYFSKTCGYHCIFFLYNNVHAENENILFNFINKLRK